MDRGVRNDKRTSKPNPSVRSRSSSRDLYDRTYSRLARQTGEQKMRRTKYFYTQNAKKPEVKYMDAWREGALVTIAEINTKTLEIKSAVGKTKEVRNFYRQMVDEAHGLK